MSGLGRRQGSSSDRRFITSEVSAAAVDALYVGEDRLAQVTRTSYERATSPAYRWSRIAEQWHAVFADVLRKTGAVQRGEVVVVDEEGVT